MHLQMIPGYADRTGFRGRKRVIFEYLAVETTGEELHADFIPFDFVESGE